MQPHIGKNAECYHQLINGEDRKKRKQIIPGRSDGLILKKLISQLQPRLNVERSLAHIITIIIVPMVRYDYDLEW